jgi:hypothetical protein
MGAIGRAVCAGQATGAREQAPRNAYVIGSIPIGGSAQDPPATGIFVALWFVRCTTFGCLKFNFDVGSSVRHRHLGDGLARGGAAELCEPTVVVCLPGSDRNLDPGRAQSVSAERFDLGAP